MSLAKPSKVERRHEHLYTYSQRREFDEVLAALYVTLFARCFSLLTSSTVLKSSSSSHFLPLQPVMPTIDLPTEQDFLYRRSARRLLFARFPSPSSRFDVSKTQHALLSSIFFLDLSRCCWLLRWPTSPSRVSSLPRWPQEVCRSQEEVG